MVKELYDAFARRDRETFLALVHPQIEWASAENFIYADHSPYIGADAVLKLLVDRVHRDWDSFRMNVQEILGGGEIVIASGRFHGTDQEPPGAAPSTLSSCRSFSSWTARS